MSIQVTTLDAAKILKDTLADREFVSGACSNEDQEGETQQPFYRTVKRVIVSGRRVDVETESVNMKTLFDTLDFRFTWSPPHKDPLNPHEDAAVQNDDEQQAEANQKDAPRRGRRRLFLDKIGDFFDNLGEDIGDAFKNLIDGAMASVDEIKRYWEGIADTVKKALKGEDAKFDETLNLFNMNFDTKTRKALEPSNSAVSRSLGHLRRLLFQH